MERPDHGGAGVRGETEAEVLASVLLTPRWHGVRWLGARLLEGVPACVSEARSWVMGRLRGDAPDVPADTLHVTTLLTSELATNAIIHSHSRNGVLMIRVGVSHPRPGASRLVHLEVVDGGSDGCPAVRPDADGESGRGLFLVEAMTERWGTAQGNPGHVVWCQIPYVPA